MVGQGDYQNDKTRMVLTTTIAGKRGHLDWMKHHNIGSEQEFLEQAVEYFKEHQSDLNMPKKIERWIRGPMRCIKPPEHMIHEAYAYYVPSEGWMCFDCYLKQGSDQTWGEGAKKRVIAKHEKKCLDNEIEKEAALHEILQRDNVEFQVLIERVGKKYLPLLDQYKKEPDLDAEGKDMRYKEYDLLVDIWAEMKASEKRRREWAPIIEKQLREHRRKKEAEKIEV